MGVTEAFYIPAALALIADYHTGGTRSRSLDDKRKAEPKKFTPVPPGSNTNAVIVLMSDGRRTTGPDPLDAARMAAERGVRVFTVGFGTEAGGLMEKKDRTAKFVLDEDQLGLHATFARGLDLSENGQALDAFGAFDRPRRQPVHPNACGAPLRRQGARHRVHSSLRR